MTFNESNTVEAFIRDRLQALGWEFIDHANLPRQPQEVLVEDQLRDTLVRLNPTIAERPERTDEVLYRLRAAIMTVRDTGLVKANEEFAAWLLGERSMPFGENGEHVTIRLIDCEDPKKNRFVVTQQFTIRAGKTEKRADLVLLVHNLRAWITVLHALTLALLPASTVLTVLMPEADALRVTSIGFFMAFFLGFAGVWWIARRKTGIDTSAPGAIVNWLRDRAAG